MIFLIVLVTFFSSVDKEPYTVTAHAPSAEACKAKGEQLAAAAEKDPEVESYLIRCVVVPTKS